MGLGLGVPGLGPPCGSSGLSSRDTERKNYVERERERERESERERGGRGGEGDTQKTLVGHQKSTDKVPQHQFGMQ